MACAHPKRLISRDPQRDKRMICPVIAPGEDLRTCGDTRLHYGP